MKKHWIDQVTDELRANLSGQRVTKADMLRSAEFEYAPQLHIMSQPATAREFFHALGIYRDPMKAMG